MKSWYEISISGSKNISSLLNKLNLCNISPSEIKIVKIDQRYLVLYYSENQLSFLK